MAGPLHPEIRAVVFDVVGTLLYPNPSAPAVYAEAARRRGLDLSPADARARFVEAHKTQELIDRAAGWVTSEEREHDRWRSIVAVTLRGVPDPEACFHELFEHFSKPASWRIERDAAAGIGKLQERGLVVGLGSNYDARLWSVLDGFPELAPLRERVVVSAAVGFRKPAAEFFREVVRAAGCAPGEILFVGDDIGNDYTGATAASLNAVLLDETGRYPSLVKRIKRLTELTD
jgi:putative hydrolase of the HAD superfamily